MGPHLNARVIKPSPNWSGELAGEKLATLERAAEAGKN